MVDVSIYSMQACGYCQSAERLLARKGVQNPIKIRVDTAPEQLNFMMAKTGRRTVPQIFIGDLHVGGFDDLVALEKSGQLDKLLGNFSPDVLVGKAT
jgi:glutaredoxin 3